MRVDRTVRDGIGERLVRAGIAATVGIAVAAFLAAPAAGQQDTTRYPTVHPRGQLQTDVAFYQEDRNPLSNGVEARRARLAAAGELSSRSDYLVEVDFADDQLNVRDAWLRYRIARELWLQAGNFKEPFTLENLTHALWISFLERSLPVLAFAPQRHLGAALRIHRAPVAATAGIFAQEVGTPRGPTLQGSQAYGVAGRVAVAPLADSARVLHLGLDLRWRKPDFVQGDSQVVRFRSLSETHVDQITLYDTGAVDSATSYAQVVAEAAAVRGPLSLQGEYVRTRVARRAGGDPAFAGGYVFLSVIPTGESRAYDPVNAEFTGVSRARRHTGVLELLLRYSWLDLNDAGLTGGSGHDWTGGVSWYPGRNERLMLEYVLTHHDLLATGDGAFAGGDEFHVFQFRVQLDF